jgi:hypothetical protein
MEDLGHVNGNPCNANPSIRISDEKYKIINNASMQNITKLIPKILLILLYTLDKRATVMYVHARKNWVKDPNGNKICHHGPIAIFHEKGT